MVLARIRRLLKEEEALQMCSFDCFSTLLLLVSLGHTMKSTDYST